MIDKEIISSINKRLKELHIKKYQLAELLGISNCTLSKIFNQRIELKYAEKKVIEWYQKYRFRKKMEEK